jgi:hypothetical protein
MSKLSYTECFAKYGAKLANRMWAVSAEAPDGAIVISCWHNYFSRPEKDTLRYTDTLSRWEGNAQGNNLLSQHLNTAQAEGRPIRLVVATALDTNPIDKGWDASVVSKTFHPKPELVGTLVSFDGDQYVIDFRRQ